MSLKAFHIFFISASILLAAGCAGWSFHNYSLPGGTGRDLWGGLAAVAAMVGLLLYGVYFLKKLKANKCL